jgi:hypothetical protein
MNRDARIAMNEAVFRDVNERINDVAQSFDLGPQPLDLICECGNAECVKRIRLTKQEYEEVRADPRHFAVAPGHAAPDVDEVIARRDGYDVVSKNEGEPEKIARETDPREND